MALDPVKIPQNVYVEDRIIGPITLRQIFLTLGGGGVSYAIYAIMKQAGKLTLVTGILSWTPLIIMAAFAFLKINGINLFRFLLLMAEKSEKPTVRYWQPRKGIRIKPRSFVPRNTKKKKDSSSHTQEEYDEISKLSTVLDSGPIVEKKKAENTEGIGPASPVEKDRVSVEANSTNTTDTFATPSGKESPATKNAVHNTIPPQNNG